MQRCDRSGDREQRAGQRGRLMNRTKGKRTAVDNWGTNHRQVNQQKFEIGTLDGRRMWVDVPGYPLSSGLITKEGTKRLPNKEKTQ